MTFWNVIGYYYPEFQPDRLLSRSFGCGWFLWRILIIFSLLCIIRIISKICSFYISLSNLSDTVFTINLLLVLASKKTLKTVTFHHFCMRVFDSNSLFKLFYQSSEFPDFFGGNTFAFMTILVSFCALLFNNLC